MSIARRALAGAALAAAVVVTVTACGVPAEPDTSAEDATVASATAFLDAYVEDGRVVRTDQGRDTVSEGQAYGMLLAVAAGDPARFDRIWDWTTANLRRDDLLLSWQWKDGGVVDEQPASDADLDAARALVLAGDAFGRDDLREQGVALGAAVLDEMTAETSLGRILLPGPWATASPHAYNPSYASPAAYAVLEQASGDPRWAELAEGSRAATAALLDANALPTDWATVAADGSVAIAGSAGGGGEPGYGYDAARTAIRFAESCDPADRALAARVSSALPEDEALPAELDSGAGPRTTDQHPVAYAARAAAAAADGRSDDARADLERMTDTAASTPTYYGSAWNALTTAMLSGDVLGGCPALTDDAGGAAAQSTTAPGVGAAAGFQDPVAPSSANTAPPVHISIPSIGVSSDLVGLDRGEDGWIQAPADYDAVGWYEKGVLPGEVGPAVIAGHVDSPTGPAVFIDLPRLAPGDTVAVERADGSTANFVVTGLQTVEKDSFPTESIYAPTPTPQLRLVTCAGAWDPASGHYVDNLVVTAVAA
ncbi:class F sortase [Microbacterium sp. KSW4-17]|uniref:Class F sortase n=1 Tax=Microbacterium galbum TaxID=3075994 RepID=A0ABU3T722_9MICO|nr:class F sortase [Microbacterium sp. KSW4-17]MDU0367177.1 class F sortase [Microbacterium sp. KSW4-17]